LSIADRKAREKEKRRTDIINAAEKQFFSKGYDYVSFEDIAREVELNRATIYLYFKNKESLYLAIVLRAVQQLYSVTKDRLSNCDDSYRRIDALGYSYLYFARVYPDYFRVYKEFQTGRFDAIGAADAVEDWNEILTVQKEYLSLWFDVFRRGKLIGIINPTIDPHFAAVLMMSTIESIAEMRPALKDVLESSGVNSYAFVWSDFRYFIYNLIATPEKKGEFLGRDSKWPNL